MGEDANDIVVSFGLTTEEAKQHNVVNKKFEAHFRGEEKRNVWTSKVQSEKGNKMVGQWIISWQTCIVLLNTVNLERWDDLIRDRIVVGIKKESPWTTATGFKADFRETNYKNQAVGNS